MAKEGQGISGVRRAEDGHVYYLIGNADSSTFIARVRTISERNALTGNGIVLVTEAYKGDPTVNRGWALYLSIGSSTTTTSVRWLKIAEAETVDGIWGFQEEVLRTLVKKPVYARHVEWNEAEHEIFKAAIKEWKKYQPHTHANLETLDKISLKGRDLWYDGNPISDTYRYNEPAGADGMLVWKNPLNTEDVVGGLTSNEVAERFCSTELAKPNTAIQIREADGSISTFVICSKNEGVTPIFAWTIGGNLSGFEKAITFTDKLPTANANYVGKGYWYLLPPAQCGNLAGHFFECVVVPGDEISYRWKDVTDTYSQVNTPGAKMLMCCKSEWNKTIIAFKDPEDTDTVKFKTTYVVRKIGSKPTNRFDGVLICKESTRDQYSGNGNNILVDACPMTNEKVYYGVFSEAASGACYAVSDTSTKEAKFPEWSDIKKLMTAGIVGVMLKVGDEVALPNHADPKIGSIVCKVIAVAEDGKSVRMVATDSIEKLPMDAIEYGMKIATGKYQGGVEYFKYDDGTDPSKQKYIFVKKEDYTVGDNIGDDVFVGPTNSVVTEDFGDYVVLHGSTEVSESNLLQWLNADTESGWYSQKNPYDKLDPKFNRIGFKFGFEDEEFKELLIGVTIPSKSELSEAGVTVPSWISDPTDINYRAAILDTSKESGFSVLYPETLAKVVPVITIGV